MDAPSQPQPAPAALPEIPGYRIEAVIGRGSSGVVYRAVQIAVERRVALKVLHPELAGRGRAVRRLQREARTTAKLAHPGIVTAIDMGQANGLWWYAMELVDGPSLAEKLKRDGAMSERDALKFFIPLCEALEHAALQGVVHRDLKPGNILIDASGRARIVDLGLALAEDDPSLTAQGGTLGTPHYISPEQARNPKNADVRSDIWSLGATMFHCVCGRPPFAGASVAEILSGVLYAPIPDPLGFAPELSRNLTLVLRKCLARDPARRYQHPREVREDLERIRERREVSVKRHSLDPLAGERERTRRRAWTAASLGGLALVAALLAWSPWRGRDAGESSQDVVEPFKPLEQLAALLEIPDAKIAPALERLTDLGPAVPPRNQGRADEVRAALRAKYDTQLLAARARFEAELDRLWVQQRDFAGALDWIDRGLEERLRAELGASTRQIAEIGVRFQLAETRARVDEDRKLALGALQQRLSSHYSNTIAGERAKAALEAGKWRKALAHLDVSARSVLTETRAVASGFSASDQEAVLRILQGEVIAPAVNELKERWRADDRRRSIELLRSKPALVNDVHLGKVADVAAELERAYKALLARDRVEPDEILDQVSDELRARRDAIRAEVAPIEAEVRLRVAESLLADRTKGLEERWRSRAFAEIAAEFEALAANPSFAPVSDRAGRIAAQGRVLRDVLGRAAAEIERLSRTREEVELPFGSLVFRGRVEEGQQVFEKGFRFRPANLPSAPPRLYALRELPSGKGEVLGRPALEKLAGLAAPALDADRKFELALLRWHLGDHEDAAQVRLESPANAEWVPLTADLASWIAGVDERNREAERRRGDAARLLLGKVRAASTDGAADARTQCEWIDELLTQYLDLDFVGAEAEWLRERNLALRPQIEKDDRALLQRVFGPSELELVESGIAKMRYVFDGYYSGPFQRSNWQAEVGGWIAPAKHSRVELSDERLWPTLYLQAPLELGGALELAVVIEQPVESGEPQLFSLSVAGVHVVFLGPSNLGQKGRWRVSSGGPENYRQLLADVLDRRRGSEFDPFQKGERYRIRVELKQGRGDVSVWINDKLLGRETPLRPESGDAGDRSLTFRSLEPVRVVEATLRARFR